VKTPWRCSICSGCMATGRSHRPACSILALPGRPLRAASNSPGPSQVQPGGAPSRKRSSWPGCAARPDPAALAAPYVLEAPRVPVLVCGRERAAAAPAVRLMQLSWMPRLTRAAPCSAGRASGGILRASNVPRPTPEVPRRLQWLPGSTSWFVAVPGGWQATHGNLGACLAHMGMSAVTCDRMVVTNQGMMLSLMETLHSPKHCPGKAMFRRSGRPKERTCCWLGWPEQGATLSSTRHPAFGSAGLPHWPFRRAQCCRLLKVQFWATSLAFQGVWKSSRAGPEFRLGCEESTPASGDDALHRRTTAMLSHPPRGPCKRACCHG